MSSKEEFVRAALEAIVDVPAASLPGVIDFASHSKEDVQDATAIAIRAVEAVFSSDAMKRRDTKMLHDTWAQGRSTGLSDFQSAHDTPNPFPLEES